jgi:conserved domain protein
MSPRTGRPKTENPINIRTSVRLDAETDRKLNDYCEKHGITKGEAIRKGVHLLLAKEK